MPSNVDLYYIHLFNDFSGSPRVLRDGIDSEITSFDNTYIFTSRHKGFLDDVDGHRINCFYSRSNNRYIQLFYYLLSQILLFFQLFFYLCVSRLRGHKVTVVVNTMLPFSAVLAGKILGARVISYVHETHIQPPLLKQFLRFFIEHCSHHVIFVSKYLQTAEFFSKPIQSVIYNGLRSDFPLIEKIDVNSKFENKILLFAGSLKDYKGIEQLFEVAVRLPEFKIVAALNCTETELKIFIKGRDLPKNVQVLSRPENIQGYFQRSFAVLNLSLPDGWIETFGLSLIEGMAYGSPVVAPPVGGPTEFVNSSNGYLVDARCTDEIVDFLRYLNSSLDVWILFSEQAFLTSKKFRNSIYKSSFKSYFERYNLN
ncbi:glycosyltransferase family 4 protein [Vibrio splendidus]|uniref:glycosyltransferase family 4 protein n=1 Tax=Vibrio splendidus TaxID=29497 RepID=UPI000D3CD43E|nr:glycosyltransferase family 4 protein [Vibrio splendidus]PTP72405.1 hypothetical protein CWO00_17960 [Vibrio splendidus]